ncbi:hypothetical protein [Ruegeria sp. HKCCSP335]|uniref:hypothetical protein n=1 Tax=Ruegeria sp. HKCCSP335 TaxID=2794833 RepID=UPI001AE9BB18|nr:hypothetical protein [Ruegeria sp. HKCCSP335]
MPQRGHRKKRIGQSMSSAGGISASTIKSWFQYRCERKTRYEIMSDSELAAVPITPDVREQLWADLGIDFENRVVDALSDTAQQSVLRPGKSDKFLSENLTIAFLKGLRPEKFATQLNLRPKSDPFELLDTGLELRRTFPDLVRVDRSKEVPVFTVIDIKATRHATAFHKAQVAYYVRILEAAISELDISAEMDKEGEVWRIADNGSAEGAEYQTDRFNLSPYLRMVDDFLANTIKSIFAKRVNAAEDQTFFHIYFKCEQCKFLEHCQRKIAPSVNPGLRDVSAIPGMSHDAKRTLLDLGIDNVRKLSTADGLAKFHGVGWSLQRRATSFLERARAQLNSEVKRTSQEHTYLMPPRVDVAFFLSVDHDPVDDTIAAIGLSIVRNVKGNEDDREIVVIEDGKRRSEVDGIVSVLGHLIAEMTKIDTHNKEVATEDRLTAHIFFYENAEATNLHKAVARHLEDPRIRTGLINIVRLFPPEDVVPEPEFRGAHHLPATIVRNVLEQLYALPVSVAYDLRQTSNALFASGLIAHAYKPKEEFERPFSSLLALDVVRALREGKLKSISKADIELDVASRLQATAAMVDWLFQEDEKCAQTGQPRLLRLIKKPFAFHESFDPLNAEDLDILQALELLQNRAGMLETLINLAQHSDTRRDRGQCIAGLSILSIGDVSGKGRPRKRLTFKVPTESQDSDIRPGDFDLILHDDNPDVRLDPSCWEQCKVDYWEPSQSTHSGTLTVSMPRDIFEDELFQEMLRRAEHKPVWHIDRRFFDVNCERAANFIRNLAEASGL